MMIAGGGVDVGDLFKMLGMVMNSFLTLAWLSLALFAVRAAARTKSGFLHIWISGFIVFGFTILSVADVGRI